MNIKEYMISGYILQCYNKPGKKALQLRKIILSLLGQHPHME